MIEPNEADSDTRRVYDGVLKQWGRISNFSKVLAHQPAALEGWMRPNEMIRLANIKSDPDYVMIQQLVIIKTSALNQDRKSTRLNSSHLGISYAVFCLK